MKEFKYFAAVTLSFVFYGMFSLLDVIVGLSDGYILFFVLVSCFEYLGIEKLLCVEPPGKTPLFDRNGFVLSALAAPFFLYCVLAAVRPEVFGTSAKVCLGTVLFRLAYGIAKLFKHD